MTVYAKFYRKRTWHIVAPGYELSVAADVPTVCGEPSISVRSGDRVEILRVAPYHPDGPPEHVCQRCEKRNQ